MSKKFTGKACAYCVENVSATEDHVFAEKFFLAEHRNNLPKVPACLRCNKEKSKLEHYATAVMPLAGRHPAAIQNCLENAPRRLQKNGPLRRDLFRGRSQRWGTSPSGLIVPETTFPVDVKKIKSLYAYIAAGLVRYHNWDFFVSPEKFEILPFQPDLDHLWRGLLPSIQNLTTNITSIEKSLGNSTVVYAGFYSPGKPVKAAWLISIYGIHFGDRNAPERVWRVVGAFTDPPEKNGFSAP